MQSSLRHKPLASTAEPNILLNRCVSIHYCFSDRQMASSDSMSLLVRPKLRTQHHRRPFLCSLPPWGGDLKAALLDDGHSGSSDPCLSCPVALTTWLNAGQ